MFFMRDALDAVPYTEHKKRAHGVRPFSYCIIIYAFKNPAGGLGGGRGGIIPPSKAHLGA